jgi:putative methionine-R-sulfoxide reductase with GAF domain
MYPINNYETIRRGHEELLKRAEYERMARKAIIEQRMNRKIHKAANWLGIYLVRWGEKLEQFGTFSKVRQSHTTPN